jgi:hypothetical protein
MDNLSPEESIALAFSKNRGSKRWIQPYGDIYGDDGGESREHFDGFIPSIRNMYYYNMRKQTIYLQEYAMRYDDGAE